jgi:hypothetical protein
LVSWGAEDEEFKEDARPEAKTQLSSRVRAFIDGRAGEFEAKGRAP